MDMEAYIEALASTEPTPGGGSAAAVVGAMGAALLVMVGRITLGSARLVAVHPAAQRVVDNADALRLDFLDARVRDEIAYRAVVAAQALPRDSAVEQAARTAALAGALCAAAEAPLAVTETVANAMGVAADAAALGNAHLMSDVECAVRFLRAAFDASVANIAVNHRFMKDDAAIARQSNRLEEIRPVVRAYEDRAAQNFR